jgi:hypothetical protein
MDGRPWFRPENSDQQTAANRRSGGMLPARHPSAEACISRRMSARRSLNISGPMAYLLQTCHGEVDREPYAFWLKSHMYPIGGTDAS